MTYEKRQRKKSQFTSDSTIGLTDTWVGEKSGVNKKATIQDLLDKVAEVYGASARVYETQSELEASDIQLSELAIVIENRYATYEVTNDAVVSGSGDVALDSGTTASRVGNLQSSEVDNYAALRLVPTAALADGQVFTVTDSGKAGDGVIRYDPAHGLADNGGTIIVINADWYWDRVYNGAINVQWFEVFGDGVTSDQAIIDGLVYRDATDVKTIFFPKADYAMNVFRPRNVKIVAESGARILLTQAGGNPVMGQINSNTVIEDLTIESLETNLNFQRCNIVNANSVRLTRCKIIGFRDTSAPIDAWGLYLDGCTNILIEQCGFDLNSQSDIAFVDNNRNIVVTGCYGISGTLHINIEPNTSSDINDNIVLSAMDLSFLSMLENGSGSTSSRNIVVNGCAIGTLKYDGASCVLDGCTVDAFEVETEVYFGEAVLNNTLCLGPNLLVDPYCINVGQNSGTAATNSNSWYVNSVSGITTYRSNLSESGVRYTRFNPSLQTGVLNFRPTTAISVTSGEYYLIAVTGRRFSGSSGQFLQVFNGSEDKNCRLFRQSTFGNNYWATELAIVPAAATASILTKVGMYVSSTIGFDLRAITVHRVYTGRAANAHAVLRGTHSLNVGVREMIVDTIPTMGSALANGFQNGDRLILSSTGVSYYWNGAAFTAI
jgi:hypothetical protein